MQELRRLKAIHLGLTKVYKDGELGSKDIDKLLGAMEEIGVELVVPGAFVDMVDEVDGADGEGDGMAGIGRVDNEAAISIEV